MAIYPNYNNSIVNLTSSILDAFSVKSPYSRLKELKSLKESKNIILLLIDGLGYEYLKKYGENSYLKKHCVKKITSVFPSTTASAATTLETGVAPQQHGITGWFMFLKELGTVSAILPFKPRYGGISFPNNEIQRKDIFSEKTINDKIKQPSFIIYPKMIVDGKVNKKSKDVLTYKTLNGMFSQIKKAINSSNEEKYIYSYWSEFDSICHDQGCTSKQSNDHFWELDNKIASFVKSIKKTNFTMLITADHGLIDTPKSKIINLRDHPRLYETLTLPLCGEPRVAYCYVHPEKTIQFENYIKTNLSHCCEIYKSTDLINQGVFGLFNAHKMLKDRIGDYTLIMKENYIIKDSLLKEKEHPLIGNHGGTSKEEMFVPLIQIKNLSQ